MFNSFPNKPWFLSVCGTSLLKTLREMEKLLVARNGEIARSEQYLFFPQCFLPVWRTFCCFDKNLKLSSANSFGLEDSKICRLGKG